MSSQPPSTDLADRLASLATTIGPGDAQLTLTSQAAKERLRTTISACTACPLHQTRIWGVPFTSPAAALPIVLLSDAPGKSETATGLPVQGKVGGILNQALEAVHLSRDSVHMVNLVACRPAYDKYDAVAMDACNHWYVAQMSLTEAWVVVALGPDVLARLIGPCEFAREVKAGPRWVDGRYVIPTYHPRHVEKTGNKMSELVDALRVAADIVLRYEYAPKQPSARVLEVVEYLGSEALDARTPQAAKAMRLWWRKHGFIPTYSPVIGENVVVVLDGKVKVPSQFSEYIRFTVDELEKVSKLGDGGVMLRKVAAVKAVIDGEVVW